MKSLTVRWEIFLFVEYLSFFYSRYTHIMTLLTRSAYIMGTDISITLRSERDSSADIEAGFEIFRSFEREFSRFLPDSALSFLNTSGSIIPSPRFFKIMELSTRIHDETWWIFNPLVDVRRIGYTGKFRDNVFVMTDSGGDTDWKKIALSREKITLGEGQYLDLGGIVKGYSVDEVRDYLFVAWYTDFIINAGGDIYLAGRDIDRWRVGIDNPKNPSEILATLELENMAIATSGTYKRKWEIEWKKYHHILDPRTMANPSEIMSISIIGSHTWMTDVYATVGLIMWIEWVLSWLESRRLNAIIISNTWEIFTTQWLENYSPVFFT